MIYSANLVRYLRKQGDVAAADRVILEGVEMFRNSLGEDNPRLAAYFNKAGMQLADVGCYAMAQRLLSEALELNRKILGHEHEQVAATLKNLADVHHLLGDYDAMSDIEEFGQMLEDSLAELLKQARKRSKAAAKSNGDKKSSGVKKPRPDGRPEPSTRADR